MGVVPIEKLLPSHIFRPDDAVPIAALQLPATAKMTRIGFDHKPGEPLLFEGETQVKVRIQERTWRCRVKETGQIRKSQRWRLEVLVDANNPDSIQPTHQVVVAQTPYGNGWVQATTFKKYTKHTREREELEAKLPECDGMKDIEAKFEAALVYDPWETGQHYVAGISYPDGDLQLLANKPRNTAVDYVIGVCPDFKVACDELLTSTEVKRLLEMTEKDKLGFWKQGAPSKRPHLYDETKEEAQTLIMLAVRQALAGPCDFSKKWHGQPVSKLVEHLYCDHLNNRNRQISRVPKQEQFTEH